MTQPSVGPGRLPAVAGVAPRQVLLSVWSHGSGAFAARVVLADGSVRDFQDPFELVRFLATPIPPAGHNPGLR